jgi:hypothetical protein
MTWRSRSPRDRCRRCRAGELLEPLITGVEADLEHAALPLVHQEELDGRQVFLSAVQPDGWKVASGETASKKVIVQDGRVRSDAALVRLLW